MTIKSRIPKAKEAFVKVHSSERSSVDGSNGKVYTVLTTSWHARRVEGIPYKDLHCTCSYNGEECPGNTKTLCYHSMAVAFTRSAQNDKTLSLFDDLEEAVLYKNLGGELVRISSPGGHAWGVVKSKNPNVSVTYRTLHFEERVNLLRGKEEVID